MWVPLEPVIPRNGCVFLAEHQEKPIEVEHPWQDQKSLEETKLRRDSQKDIDLEPTWLHQWEALRPWYLSTTKHQIANGHQSKLLDKASFKVPTEGYLEEEESDLKQRPDRVYKIPRKALSGILKLALLKCETLVRGVQTETELVGENNQK